MVAVNTSPRDSVGYFCAADRASVADTLAGALAGRLGATELARMQVDLDGRTLSRRVLNDALFAHASPAATTRYFLEIDGQREEHKSSGVWVGPAAGSTAAQRSAGGRVLPIRSQQLQFVVREPYEGSEAVSYQLVRGLVPSGRALTLRSKIPAGRVYLDGPHRVHDVPLGGVLAMQVSDEPLTLLGLRSRNR
jgi:NAD+ kinase